MGDGKQEPSAVRAMLWAAAVIVVGSVSLGALYQRAETAHPVAVTASAMQAR